MLYNAWHIGLEFWSQYLNSASLGKWHLLSFCHIKEIYQNIDHNNFDYTKTLSSIFSSLFQMSMVFQMHRINVHSLHFSYITFASIAIIILPAPSINSNLNGEKCYDLGRIDQNIIPDVDIVLPDSLDDIENLFGTVSNSTPEESEIRFASLLKW